MEVFRDIAVVSPLADLLIDAVNKVPDQDAIVFPQSRASRLFLESAWLVG